MQKLIDSLHRYKRQFPNESGPIGKVLAWIEKYWNFAFVKDNLEGHLTGSMIIMNPESTKVLLMLHKKFQRWQQFGGHCDGQVDVRNVAIREFHEESGIELSPIINWDIFHVHVHDVPLDSKGRPAHQHFDILYLGTIPEDTPFSRQESEVDDIRWFDIDEVLLYNDERLMYKCIQKIKNLWK